MSKLHRDSYIRDWDSVISSSMFLGIKRSLDTEVLVHPERVMCLCPLFKEEGFMSNLYRGRMLREERCLNKKKKRVEIEG